MRAEAGGFNQGVDQGPNEGILNHKFALSVYDLTQRYPGKTLLGDLRLAPRTAKWNEYKIYGYSPITYPPDNWGPFYFDLDQQVRKQLSTVLKDAMSSGFRTIQQIRDTSEEQLCFKKDKEGRRQKTALSQPKALFLKTALGPDVTQ